MIRKLLISFFLAAIMSVSSGLVSADGYKRAQWKDISSDKNHFNKNCDYKVWVLEDKEWRETWYLEAFDSENAFYTINRQSSTWSDRDDFYALNYKDKTKFLTGENYIEVTPFALCLMDK